MRLQNVCFASYLHYFTSRKIYEMLALSRTVWLHANLCYLKKIQDRQECQILQEQS